MSCCSVGKTDWPANENAISPKAAVKFQKFVEASTGSYDPLSMKAPVRIKIDAMTLVTADVMPTILNNEKAL